LFDVVRSTDDASLDAGAAAADAGSADDELGIGAEEVSAAEAASAELA
jgi:hypothetical protein